MRSLVFPSVVVMCLGVSGCRVFEPSVRAHSLGVKNESSIQVVDSDVVRRATYVTVRDGKIVIAAEPPPDAGLNSTTDLTGKLTVSVPSNVSGSAEANAKIVQSIVDLTKRTQEIVILRDSYYRLAEMYLNGAITADQYKELYAKVFEGVTTLARAREKEADAAVAKVKSNADATKDLTIQLNKLGTELLDKNTSKERLDLLQQQSMKINDTIKALGGDGADPRPQK